MSRLAGHLMLGTLLRGLGLQVTQLSNYRKLSVLDAVQRGQQTSRKCGSGRASDGVAPR